VDNPRLPGVQSYTFTRVLTDSNADRGAAVDDVVRRVRAAEIVQDVADDYGVPTYVVELIAIAAEYEEDDCA